MELNTALANKVWLAGTQRGDEKKIRELVYITRVFFLLLAHEFCVHWMKNRHRSLPICLVTLMCRPTLDVTV